MARKYLAFLKVDGWSSEFKSVDKLLKRLELRTRSEATREEYLYILYKFLMFNGIDDPDKFVKSATKEELEEKVNVFLQSYQGRSSKYTLRQFKTILKSFLEVNGFKHQKELDLIHIHIPARYRARPEYVPTKDEALHMAEVAGSPKARALILFLLATGLRVSTLCALTYGDIKEEYEAEKVPMIIHVTPEMKKRVPSACKGCIPYYTFLCQPAFEALKDYLGWRIEKYGPPTEEEPLFIPDYTCVSKYSRKRRFLTPREVQLIVKQAAKRAGIKKWMHVTPHTLRKTFNSILRSELIDGDRLDPADQEFLMGHVLKRDEYYDATKIEEMRQKYSKLNFWRNTPITDKMMEQISKLKEEVNILKFRGGALSTVLETPLYTSYHATERESSQKSTKTSSFRKSPMQSNLLMHVASDNPYNRQHEEGGSKQSSLLKAKKALSLDDFL